MGQDQGPLTTRERLLRLDALLREARDLCDELWYERDPAELDHEETTDQALEAVSTSIFRARQHLRRVLRRGNGSIMR